MRLKLLYAQDVVLVVVVDIKVCHIILAALEDYEDAVVLVELAEQSAVVIVVQTVHVRVEPYLPAAQRTVSVALQRDAVYRVFGEDIAHCRPALHEDGGEVFLYKDVLQFRRGVEGHLDYFGLAVRVGGEIVHP